MSCCPPNADKYLEDTYVKKGTTHALENGHEFYSVGSASSKKAIILIPDVYGWHGGRTRNVADLFAESDGQYLVIVPKLMVPPLEGGTDGDGLYPHFSFETEGYKFPGYMSTITWEGVLKPRIVSVLGHLQSQGIEKVGLVGFCWGGWVMCHALSGELADRFVGGAIPHPSVTLEQMVYGGNTLDLIGRVQKPLLLMPAKGDPDAYRSGGEIYENLKARLPTTETIDFGNLNHGFLPRGDVSNAEVREGVERCLAAMYRFLGDHFSA